MSDAPLKAPRVQGTRRKSVRRKSDLITLILTHISIATGIIVSGLYSFDFGAKSSEPMMQTQRAALVAEGRAKSRIERDEEMQALKESIEELIKEQQRGRK